jgi:hypothetical protein
MAIFIHYRQFTCRGKISAVKYSAVECKDEVLPRIQTRDLVDTRLRGSVDIPPTIQPRAGRGEQTIMRFNGANNFNRI